MNLRALYQEMLLDHGRRPRHFCANPEAQCSHRGYNPLCGDEITIYCDIKAGRVIDLSFDGTGCAISIASASMMAEHLQNASLEHINAVWQAFNVLLTADDAPTPDRKTLGKCTILAGVREFPMRVKCATLGWHTLRHALAQAREE